MSDSVIDYEVISNELAVFTVFETCKDVSSEYEIFKVRQIDEEINALKSLLSRSSDLTVVGCIGVENLAAVFFNQVFSNNSDESESNGNLISAKTKIIKEGLFCLTKNDQVIFYYKCGIDLFSASKNINLVSTIIDYIRNLTDLCEKIFILVNEINEISAPITNPYSEKKHTSIKIIERTIQPHESINVKRLCVEGYNEIDDLKCSNDHFNILYSNSTNSFNENKIEMRTIKNCYLEGKYYQKNWYSWYNNNKDVSSTSYKQLCEAVKNNWKNIEAFRNISELATEVFPDFFEKNYKSQFKFEFEQLLHQLNDKYNKLVSEDYFAYCLQFFIDSFKLDELEKLLKSTTKGPIFGEYLVKQFKTNKSALVLKKLIHNSIDDLLAMQINDQGVTWLRENWTVLSCTDFEKRFESFDFYEQKRVELITEMLDWLEDKVKKTVTTSFSKIEVNFYEVNVIKGSDSEAISLKISRKPYTLRKEIELKSLFASKNATEQIKSNQISIDLSFVQNNIGFATVGLSLEDKSFINYFNFEKNGINNVEQKENEEYFGSHHIKIQLDLKSSSYLVYNNDNKCAEQGKFEKLTGRLKDSVSIRDFYDTQIENADASKLQLDIIKSICFVPENDLVLIIDDKLNLIEYNTLSGYLKVVMKKVNKGSHIEKIKIKPQSEDDHYSEVTSLPNGKCILLRCNKSIDIYDLNWDFVKQIDITPKFKFFKSFSFDNSTYLLVIQDDPIEKVIAYELSGFSASRKLDIHYKKEENNTEIPYLDVFYLAQRKFGPQSSFIGASFENSLCMLLNNMCNKQTVQFIKQYFDSLNMRNFSLEIKKLTSNNINIEDCETKSSIDLNRILVTRNPVHVATIEHSNIYPLKDSINISDKISIWKSSNQDDDLITHIVSLTKFGSLEHIYQEHEKPIKVIGIVGRQSSGKSYFMNRLTGSRFNVASTRCTDGIWMSLAYINDQLFVVLDCEGLFSTRRNDMEEAKLCLALSAVCDMFILNQDLSFNRYLDKLFSNFSKCCDRLKGKNLFKGIFMILIRDVSSQDAEGANTEFINSIKQNKNSYLEKLFGGNINGQCMHNFENPIFNEEIKEIREAILSLKPRWSNGTEFNEVFKFVLAQIHTDDDEYLDMRRFNKAKRQYEIDAINMFMNGNNIDPTETFKIKLKKLINDSDRNNNTLILNEIYEEIEINNSKINFESIISTSQFSNLFKSLLTNAFNMIYSEDYHNDWYENVHTFSKKLLESRVKIVINFIDANMKFDESFESEIENFKYNIKENLNKIIKEAMICKHICRLCRRKCSLNLDHSGDCDCDTDHFCKLKCSLCDTLEDSLCTKTFGHEQSDDPVHRCNQGHVCGKKCNKTKECLYVCNLEIDHASEIEHDCNQKHECNEDCQIDDCTKKCSINIEKSHSYHVCELKSCLSKCSIPGCSKLCDFPNHNHKELIKSHKEGKLSDLELLRTPEKWNITGKLLENLITYHICSENNHICGNFDCKNKCEEDGVCEVGFLDPIEKIWDNGKRKFSYIYYEPKNHRNTCKFNYEQYSNIHEGIHSCKKVEPHRCNFRCPECKSFCQLSFDHLEKYHFTSTHRNKECNVFVCKDSSSIKVKSTMREYEAGEQCKPEICSQNCETRGRSHFHLKECPGKDVCLSKTNNFVRHSHEKWRPFESKEFDMWLCEPYWHSLGWAPPVSDEIIATNKQCSFVCAHSDHGDDELSFCEKLAWHEGEHKFDCKHDTFERIEIVFCCDTTGSMGGYIENAKSTIRKIINDAAVKVKDIKFGFVAYRDHPPQDVTYVTLFHDLTDSVTILTFVNGLTASGGGDAPEAVLDGLHDSVFKIKWSEKGSTLKYLIHIADAPPHGKQYVSSGDTWPDGCPCGRDIKKIAEQMNLKSVRYKLMKIGSSVNTMASVFKAEIKNFEESELNSALDLEVKVAGIVARDLLANENDITIS